MSGWTDCPRCQGHGEVVDYINEWGKPEPTECKLCLGTGDVKSDVAADYLAEVGSDV